MSAFSSPAQKEQGKTERYTPFFFKKEIGKKKNERQRNSKKIIGSLWMSKNVSWYSYNSMSFVQFLSVF